MWLGLDNTYVVLETVDFNETYFDIWIYEKSFH